MEDFNDLNYNGFFVDCYWQILESTEAKNAVLFIAKTNWR